MKNQRLLFLIYFIFCVSPIISFGQSIVRGPYLQSPGQNSIIVRWRTDSLTNSRVSYGTDSLAPFTNNIDSLTLTTEHRVKISGLSPQTKYFYSIGSTSQVLRGPDSLLYFTTAPDTTVSTPVRIWAIGDFGHGNDEQREVKESYLRYARNSYPADIWIWLGDDAYQDGTDQEFQNNDFTGLNGFYDVFPNLPFLPTPGNHDYNSICPWQDPNGIPVLCMTDPNLHTGPYLDIIDPPTEGELGGVPSHHKMFYSYDYGDIHFVSLCSELGSYISAYNWVGVFNSDPNYSSPMLDWLRADIAATTKKWKIAYWHQCPYSAQDNFTEQTSLQYFTYAAREHFNPILEQYGIDLVMSGHDHNFQRSYLINGHYGYKASFTPSMLINGTSGNEALGEAYVKYTNGPLANIGTVYVVEGNSSGGNSYSPFSHPAMYFGHTCDTCSGSFIIDINDNKLVGRYLYKNDSILDEFTIIKNEWVGIEEPDSSIERFNVYPNPFHDKIVMEYYLQKKSEVKINVLDIVGSPVYSMPIVSREAGPNKEVIDLQEANLAKGMYFIRLEAGGVKYKKVIKLE